MLGLFTLLIFLWRFHGWPLTIIGHPFGVQKEPRVANRSLRGMMLSWHVLVNGCNLLGNMAVIVQFSCSATTCEIKHCTVSILISIMQDRAGLSEHKTNFKNTSLHYGQDMRTLNRGPPSSNSEFIDYMKMGFLNWEIPFMKTFNLFIAP